MDADRTKGTDWGRRLSAAAVLFHEAVGQRLGLSPVDHRALTLIHDHAPLTAGTLAGWTGLTPGAVTGLVDRLERAGLVRRSPDPADRRRILIEPIAEGGHSLDEAFAELGTAMARFMTKYDDRELATITDYLSNTIDVLHEQTRRLNTATPNTATLNTTAPNTTAPAGEEPESTPH